MCNVCCAYSLMKGEVLKTESGNGKKYEMKGSAGKAEIGPCSYQLKQDNGKWFGFQTEKCLAEIVASGGFDVKTTARISSDDKWLEKHFKTS